MTLNAVTLVLLAALGGAPGESPQVAVDPSEVTRVALASLEPLSFDQLLDELLAELTVRLGRLPRADISPLALRSVQLSSNLAPELEETIAIRVNAALASIAGLTQVECAACFAVRSRIDKETWVVSRGVVDAAEVREVAREIGAQAFLDVRLEYLEVQPEEKLALTVRLVRGATSSILFAERLMSDQTTAALARSGHLAQSAEDRRAELEAMLLGRPHYGHAAIVGNLRVPYKSKTFDGMISGISVAYRLYEMFGDRRANLFGLQMEGFIDPTLKPDKKGKVPAAGGLFTGTYLRSLVSDDLRLPVVRVGFNAGGFIGGNLGNTVVAGAALEVLLRFRLAINASVLYVVPTKVEELDGTLGGLSYRLGGSFNWE
jgi:hypothetical protein